MKKTTILFTFLIAAQIFFWVVLLALLPACGTDVHHEQAAADGRLILVPYDPPDTYVVTPPPAYAPIEGRADYFHDTNWGCCESETCDQVQFCDDTEAMITDGWRYCCAPAGVCHERTADVGLL